MPAELAKAANVEENASFFSALGVKTASHGNFESFKWLRVQIVRAAFIYVAYLLTVELLSS